MRFSLSFVLFALAVTSARAEELPDILARMDKAAQKFHSFSAATHRTEFTAVLSETTEMNGFVRLRKSKGGTQGIVDFTEPDPRTYEFSGRTLKIFYPKANTVEIYDAGKHISTVDEIVLMGFGTSGADLRKNYQVKLAGSETLNGVRVSRLELTPKGEEVRKLTTRIELWIPEGGSNPIQEKFTQPSKDYSLVAFSDIKINAPLPESDFSLKLPKDVKKIYPQK
jgi:outer membrane lipoprotein-sorting protein